MRPSIAILITVGVAIVAFMSGYRSGQDNFDKEKLNQTGLCPETRNYWRHRALSLEESGLCAWIGPEEPK